MTLDREAIKTEYRNRLEAYRKEYECLGIEDQEYFDAFLGQLVDSIRLTNYFRILLERGIGFAEYHNPFHASFHPIKGAIWHIQNGNIAEATWLCFLYAHFGKNQRSQWGLIQSVYSHLGKGPVLSWEYTTANLDTVSSWIVESQDELSKRGSFGNHSKYKSLKDGHTNRAISSFVDWVNSYNGFNNLVLAHSAPVQDDETLVFDSIYKDMMSNVFTFSRMGTFDFLTTVGKLKLADITPGKIYVNKATGPKPGAKLFFKGSTDADLSNNQIENRAKLLSDHLGLFFGMQVLEDAFCNWQKSPAQYVRYTV
jgi:hypothetical protein